METKSKKINIMTTSNYQPVKSTPTFDILLNGFKSAIKNFPPIDKVKKELTELKNAAISDSELTEWQKDAILGRCNNYLKGEYGSTSRTIKSMKEKSSAN